MPLPSFFLARDSGNGGTLVKINIDPSRLSSASSSLGFTLNLPYEIEFATCEVMQLSGTLAYYGEYYGIAIPNQPRLFNQSHLGIPISSEQLARLERKRAGSDLTFDVSLAGFVSVADGVLNVKASNPTTIHIPREVWMRVLQTFDGRHHRLIDLPPVPEYKQGQWGYADEALQKSSWRLASGDAGGSMIETRTALEKTVEAIGASFARPRCEGDKAFRNYVEAVAEKLKSVHEDRTDDPCAVLSYSLSLCVALFSYASESAHQGLSLTTMADAEMALSITTAIYSFGVRLPPMGLHDEFKLE